MDRHKTRKSIDPSQRNQLNLVRGKGSNLRAIQMISIQLFAVLMIHQMLKPVTCATHNIEHLIHEEEESHLKNPLVLDLSTLYDRTRQAQLSPMMGSEIRRSKRSAGAGKSPNQDQAAQQLVDACQSKVEILTPYYATNSKGKLRSVVNSALMQQAIQVETCDRSPSADRAKCNSQPDCGCEQKYKWHRLLVLDTSDSGASRGLFMDWFLYPSACVCRCRSSVSSSKQFLRTIKRASETLI